MVQAGCRTEPAPEVLAAYDAPFPDETYKSGRGPCPAWCRRRRTTRRRGQPGGLASPVDVGQKPFLVAFSDERPDHLGHGAGSAQSRAGRGGLGHRRSPAPDTSSRRTPVMRSATAIAAFVRAAD